MYKVISLFSGCGGSSQGYKQAGLNVIASNEFIPFQQKAYKANHPTTKLYTDDIRTLDPLKILQDADLNVGDLDILDGSPPCASFSISGSRDKGWGKVKKYSTTEQRTDDLFDEYIRFVKAIQPKVFVAENVKGLTIGTAKGYFKQIFNQLEELGYNVNAKVLNAVNYGVPQIRTRLIIIGVRKDLLLKPIFPKHIGSGITLGKAFKDISNMQEDLKPTDCTAYAIYPELIKLKPGETSGKYFNLVKQSPYRPCNTITQTAGNIGSASICHWDNRKFTVREAKRIQTIPDDYILLGNYREQIESIGRSVPPKMMEAIARTIKTEILDKVYNNV